MNLLGKMCGYPVDTMDFVKIPFFSESCVSFVRLWWHIYFSNISYTLSEGMDSDYSSLTSHPANNFPSYIKFTS